MVLELIHFPVLKVATSSIRSYSVSSILIKMKFHSRGHRLDTSSQPGSLLTDIRYRSALKILIMPLSSALRSSAPMPVFTGRLPEMSGSNFKRFTRSYWYQKGCSSGSPFYSCSSFHVHHSSRFLRTLVHDIFHSLFHHFCRDTASSHAYMSVLHLLFLVQHSRSTVHAPPYTIPDDMYIQNNISLFRRCTLFIVARHLLFSVYRIWHSFPPAPAKSSYIMPIYFATCRFRGMGILTSL